MPLPGNPFAPDEIAHHEEEVVEEQETQAEGLTKEGLAEILAEQSRLNADNLARILQGPRAGQPLQEEIKAPGLSLEGLPHPSVDLDGFNKGLAERLAQRDQGLVEQITQRSQRAATEVATNQSLFSRAESLIREAAPELPDDVIEFSAQKIANDYRTRGVNPLDALRENLMGVAQEVLDYADSRFGGGGDQPLQRKATGGGRTQVLGGGGARAPRPKARAEDESTNIVQEIRKMQTDLRLY